MYDKFGRQIDYLRVSLTEHCNLRCMYCLPKTACPNKTYDGLTHEDYLHLVPLIASLGIKKIRLTGGEPLLYPHLAELISSFRQIKGVEQIALTTNGILLSQQIEKLKRSGLDRLNVSLDSVCADLFKRMTRGGALQNVLDGIKAARKLHLPLKLNSVILKHCNENQIVPLAEFAQNNDIVLRFIELMPLGQASSYKGASEAQLKKVLSEHFGMLHGLPRQDEASPAHYCTNPSLNVPIGFISAVSHNFCARCSRVRLTSGGVLRPCLLHDGGLDLKQMIKNNYTDEQILQAIYDCIWQKPQRHKLSGGAFLLKDCKSMAQIGG